MSIKIFIPSDLPVQNDYNALFTLVKPFHSEEGWSTSNKRFIKWGLHPGQIKITHNVINANHILIPFPINYYFENNLEFLLNNYDKMCKKNNIIGYGFISGDWGRSYPEFERLRYFRLSGYKSQLSKTNIGFPAALSDHHKTLFDSDTIKLRNKGPYPIIGFCGHATKSRFVYFYQKLRILAENLYRYFFMRNQKIYEQYFTSGFERYKILKLLENDNRIKTNFIYRDKYRAGSKNETQRKTTTMEFYNNLRSSDYVICIRGTGNFSIRLYETLMMGRIPIYINTDCILPYPDVIDWKKFVVWIEWGDRREIQDRVIDFHNNISNEDFVNMQKSNRELWLSKLQPKWILKNL